jgi:hypothetical protein
MVSFRTEVEMSLESVGDPVVPQFLLKVELMFHEASDQDIKSPWAIKQPILDDIVKKFKSVASTVYKLSNVIKGMNEYFPVSFDTLHFSSLSINIHTVLMGNHPPLILL